MEYSKSEYQEYLNKKSPNSNLAKDMILAFISGGIICVIGQILYNIYLSNLGLSDESAKILVSISLIFLGSLLTGLNLYNKLAKFSGAGTLVPITGFANAIVSPAMEFKKEGLVLGLASKMFVIAGPVLVYGISASAIVGVIYYIIKICGGTI